MLKVFFIHKYVNKYVVRFTKVTLQIKALQKVLFKLYSDIYVSDIYVSDIT